MRGVRAEVPVLLIVWVLCVTTEWSSATKIALNVAAVAGLCLNEYLTHRRVQRDMRNSATGTGGAAGSTAGRARHRAFAAA